MEVRGLPEEGTGGETAVRLAWWAEEGRADRVGRAWIGDGGMPEDGNPRPERGVAGTVGHMARVRAKRDRGLERERPGCHGIARERVGEDAE